MSKKKIYIAGKISGLPQQEVTEKFQDMQTYLEALGYQVFNPLKVVGSWDVTWHFAMKLCIKALVDCDAVYLLDCYQESPGALIEKQLAESLEIPCKNNIFSLAQLWSS